MTVTTTDNRWSYAGNGATLAFAYTNRIFADSDLKVYIDGVLKTLTTHYAVSNAGQPAGGNVTFLAAPANGTAVLIVRDVPETQGLDLAALGSFPAEENEKALDRLTVLVQQHTDDLARTLRQPDGDATNISALPVKATRATKLLAFDANGNPVASTITLAAAEALSDDAAAAAASAASALASQNAAATSATNAATSAATASTHAGTASTQATNAAASAAAAATSETNAANSAGALGFRWNFDSSTTMADPGAGDVRLNNATLASVTAIAISDTTIDSGTPDVSAWVLTWDDSSMSAMRGTLILRKIGAPQNFAIYTISGGSTDNSGWTQLAVTHVASSGSFSSNDDLMVQFVRTGDAGSLDINGLTEETTVDPTADYVPMFDASAGGNRKVKPQYLAGDPTVSAQTGGNFSAGSSTSNTLYVVSTASAVCTLPAGDSVPNGFRVKVKNNSDGLSVTAGITGDDTIDGLTSYRVPARETLTFINIDDDTWIVEKPPSFLVGDVKEWATDTLPDGGWAWVNGQTLSRATYAGLFAVWSTTYGAGDGSTTFGVRDDRGRVKAGQDDMGGAAAASRLTAGGSGVDGATLGASGGTQTHTLVTGEMPAHTHAMGTWYRDPGTDNNSGALGSAGSPSQSGPTSASTGGGGAHQNTQPTIITNFIVKT